MSTPSHLAALRHHGNYAKPAPPMRKNASAAGSLTGAASAGSAHLDASFPPPPPPISGSGDPELTGSNSTTPRGSMEHLPPPPPHLLHSDEDEPHQLRDASPQVTEFGLLRLAWFGLVSLVTHVGLDLVRLFCQARSGLPGAGSFNIVCLLPTDPN